MFSSQDEFVNYFTLSQQWDDTRKPFVKQALKVVCRSIIMRQRWTFLQKETFITVIADTNTYDLSQKLAGYLDSRILQVKSGDNPPLEYVTPWSMDNRKVWKDTGETEDSGTTERWTIRKRGANLAPILEVWRAPGNSSDKLYILYLSGLTDEVINYLLQVWSHVVTAGMVGSLQSRTEITTPAGAVIKSSAMGAPDGYIPYEKAIQEMEQNEPIIEELDPAPQDSDWTNLYTYLSDIN